MPRLVIINGKPGSGKTTLAAVITDNLGLPVLSKDGIKEYLFDTLGTKDRAWGSVIGAAATEMLYAYMGELLAKSHDVVIECPFWADFTIERIQEICQKTNTSVLELYCRADDKTRTQRHYARKAERHPGHVDDELVFDDTIDDERYRPLALGKVVYIDTTNTTTSEYDPILKEMREFLNQKEN